MCATQVKYNTKNQTDLSVLKSVYMKLDWNKLQYSKSVQLKDYDAKLKLHYIGFILDDVLFYWCSDTVPLFYYSNCYAM